MSIGYENSKMIKSANLDKRHHQREIAITS